MCGRLGPRLLRIDRVLPARHNEIVNTILQVASSVGRAVNRKPFSGFLCQRAESLPRVVISPLHQNGQTS